MTKSVRLQLLVTLLAFTVVGLILDVRGLPPRKFIWDATVRGDLVQARRAINWGANVNARNIYGSTPLHEAAWQNHKDIVKLLIVSGADVNAMNSAGCVPLHRAAARGNREVAELLIAEGAEINARRDSGMTPLHAAAMSNHEGIAELLIGKGAVVDLHAACALGMADRVHRILGADPESANAKLADGSSPLHWAARNARKDAAELLITGGADVNARNDYDWTPLHVAASWGRREVVQLLIARGADVNVEDNESHTPLQRAMRFSHWNVVELLRQHGAKE